MEEKTLGTVTTSDPGDYQHVLIGLLTRHEKLIRDLYQVFADTQQEYMEFWIDIAKEEEDHAKWLEKFILMSEERKAYFSEERFGIIPIEQAIEEIEQKIAEVKKFPLKPIEALGTSINIENGMLESRFFNVYEGDSFELKDTLERLERSTKDHLAKVVAMYEKEKERTDLK